MAVAFRPELADFGAFYERTYQAAYRTALGVVREQTLADDVTQQAYVAAWEHRETFRGDVPAQAWLHRIVINQALSALRRNRPTIRELTVADAAVSDGAPPDGIVRMGERIALFDALGQLPPRSRAAVVLRYYHDYDYAAIARILGTSPTNVGAILSRALDRLRDELEPAPLAAAAGRAR